MKTVDIDYLGTKVSICYRQRGTGKTILLVHGWGHSGEIWSQLSRKLSHTYCVIAIDLPGFGCSPAFEPDMINVEQYSNLLIKIVQRILGKVLPFIVIADSLGAIIILRLLENNYLISKKIMLSGCPFDGLPKTLKFLIPRGFISRSLRFLQMAPIKISTAIIRLFSLYTVHRLNNVNRSIIHGVLSADPNTAEILFRQLSSKMDHLIKFKIPKSYFRSVIVRGEYDRIVRRDTSVRLAGILDADYVEIPGVGHTPMVEDVDRYLGALSSLLA